MVHASDEVAAEAVPEFTVRLAEPRDLPAVVELLRRFLTEEDRRGEGLQLTRRTLDTYRDRLRAYLTGDLRGVVALALAEGAVVGLAAAGEPEGAARVDHHAGWPSVVWLVWVQPELRQLGLALRMLHCGKPRLAELGFETASMGVLESNREGHRLCESFGAKLVERVYHFDLREVGHQ